MTRKPLIGLTATRLPHPDRQPSFTVNEAYTASILGAGAVPVMIPSDLSDSDLERLIPHLDGILFTGGFDMNPSSYGSLPHPKAKRIDDQRDRVECHLLQACLQANKPFLGICRGMQVVNVALGGTLYEDLLEQFPSSLHHDNHDKPRHHLAHLVDVKPGSQLAKILESSQVRVNSLHHQGVRNLPELLDATALAPDGLVEAVEIPDARFGLAVQWHPEELQDHAPMRRLFQAFIAACESTSSTQKGYEIDG